MLSWLSKLLYHLQAVVGFRNYRTSVLLCQFVKKTGKLPSQLPDADRANIFDDELLFIWFCFFERGKWISYYRKISNWTSIFETGRWVFTTKIFKGEIFNGMSSVVRFIMPRCETTSVLEFSNPSRSRYLRVANHFQTAKSVPKEEEENYR